MTTPHLLLSQTKTEPLHVKRLKLTACEVFKIVNKLSPKYTQDMISIKTSTYNFRGERKADIPRVNTTRYGLRSFRSQAPRIWNSLPNNLRVAESYPQFRGLRALTRILKTGVQDSHLAKSRSPTGKSGSPTQKKLESHQFVHTYIFSILAGSDTFE